MKSFFTLFLITTSMIFSGCALLTANLKDPEVKILDLSVSKMSAEDIDLDLKLNIQNPNPVALEVSKISYGLVLSGKPVTEGVFAHGAKVAANGSSELVVPLKFKYSAINNLISSFLNKTLTKDYELKGAVDLGFLSIPFTQKGEIKLK